MEKAINKIIASVMSVILISYTLPIYAVTNEETVFSKYNSDGEKYQTIVTTKNNDEVTEEESNKELPLETKITYKLDDKEISAKELAGKSGKVSIKIEYMNKSEKEVEINGKKETMYTPFVVAVGSIIDNENNKNIEITNGKIIENGDKSIAIGLVMPGLEESLKLSGELDKIDIPSYVEITMDSTNFEMKNIMSYASSKVLDKDIDWSKFNDLFDSVNLLKTSTDQIENGANSLKEGMVTLKDGTVTLNEGAVALNEGAGSLNDGIKKLKEGANTLNSGISTLKTGTDSLNEGAQSLASGATELSEGASSVNEGANSLNSGISDLQSGLQEAGTGIASLKDGSSKLATGASSVNSGANDLKNGLDTLNTNVETLATGMVQISTSVNSLDEGLSQINGSVSGLKENLSIDSSKLSEIESLINGNNAIISALGENATPEMLAVLNGNIQALEEEKALLTQVSKIDELATGIATVSAGLSKLNESTQSLPQKSEELKTGVNQLVAGATSLAEGTKSLSDGATNLDNGAEALSQGASKLNAGAASLKTGSEALANGTKSLSDGASRLNTGASELATGTQSVASGVNSLSAGSSSLNSGAVELANGSEALVNGSSSLANGTANLTSGVDRLVDGTSELYDGVHKFNVEGITKINNVVNVDLKNVVTRGKKLEQLSKDFNSFASNDERDEIKFISIIDSITLSKKDETKEDIVTDYGKEEK